MAAAADGEQDKELLSSVVADIRSYSGSDPLRPWLRYAASLPTLFSHSPPASFPLSIDRLIRRPPLVR